ncbi:MAG: hypothetical protein IKW74_03590, partial [Thermoguttaceae bacterium]|nr:hypothetical protein [Thermoguttaceae bacterium]
MKITKKKQCLPNNTRCLKAYYPLGYAVLLAGFIFSFCPVVANAADSGLTLPTVTDSEVTEELEPVAMNMVSPEDDYRYLVAGNAKYLHQGTDAA